jgi:hypothetical protein
MSSDDNVILHFWTLCHSMEKRRSDDRRSLLVPGGKKARLAIAGLARGKGATLGTKGFKSAKCGWAKTTCKDKSLSLW